ncbi:MAG: AMP-binding protein [Methylobacteriaceae bacterium]|nr:AMP-binding protein [Methylobacteriaceae bacterium]MCC0001624.1 AMP-binding protein [Methylobacteriaceae bacterium]
MNTQTENPPLLALIDQGAPDDILFHFDGAAVSRKNFARKIAQTAGWLSRKGIGEGDVVAVWLVNRVEWLALLFAAARLGAIVAAVNTRYRAADVAHVVGLSGAKMLVLEPGFRSIDFPAILRDLDPAAVPALEKIAIVGAGAVEAPWRCVPFDAFETDAPAHAPGGSGDAPLLLFTTSGTTKGPKLVAHSQTTLAGHARSIAAALKISPDASLLAMLPFCGTFGMASLLGFLAGGARIHAMDAFDAPPALRILQDEQITHAFGSDEMFRRILALTDEAKPFPHAKIFGFAAFQPGWRDFAAEAETRGLPLHGLYGSSEVQALFSIGRSDAHFADRIECGGWPMSPRARVRVRDSETNEIAGAGVSGEIEIEAPSRFLGYFKNPQATAEATTADGFFRTGDIGRMRDDGSFIYETRAGDAMRLGGFLVGPGEIEDELKACEGVADAQVVAIDIGTQTRCAAFVIVKPGATPQEAELIAHVRARLAGYKVPARISFIDAFPVTDSANGVKIQRAKLRAMAIERIAEA